MAFNITTFQSKNKLGFLKSSNFIIQIMRPPWAQNDPGFKEIDLVYLAHAVTLPGVQVLTNESRIYGQGPMVKMPYDIGTTDTTINFYVDGAGKTLHYFYEWLKNIVNLSHTQNEVRTGALSNQVSYRKDYTTKIEIMLYGDRPPNGVNPEDHDDAALSIYTLYDAFPTGVTEPVLSWNMGSEILGFGVTFAYRSFEVKKFEPDSPSGIAGNGTLPPIAVPRSLSDYPPQFGASSQRALSNHNNYATNLRDRLTQIHPISSSRILNNTQRTIRENEIYATTLNILNTKNDLKRRIEGIKGLNQSISRGIEQDIKGSIGNARNPRDAFKW